MPRPVSHIVRTRRVDDPALPTAALAVDPDVAQDALGRALARPGEDLTLLGLRLVRHECRRRLVVDYDLERHGHGGDAELVTARAEIRRRRSGRAEPELLASLRAAGFGDDTPDGVSVPEPLGHVPELRAAVRRRVVGVPVGDLVEECYGPALMTRVAIAVHKLHGAGLPARRVHTVGDELALVRAGVGALGVRRPALAGRVLRLLAACDRLAASLPRPVPRLIHRDFTGERVLVDGGRLWLLGLDELCVGDPALDAGSFLGHLAAQAVRDHGDAAALAEAEAAFETAFLDRARTDLRRSVHAYAVMALVRDLEPASRTAGADDVTEALLEVCEARLDVGSAAVMPARSLARRSLVGRPTASTSRG